MSLQGAINYRFTTEEYHKLGEAGILGEDDRIELIEGELVIMAPIGRKHATTVRKLVRLFQRRLGDACIIDPQNPVVLDDFSEPQPDIMLLRPAPDFYASGLPRPADVFLLVEIADTSLPFDRGEKRSLYARAGIVEFWIVNLIDDVIEQYREPSAADYLFKKRFKCGEQIEAAQFPGIPFSVEEILP